MRQENHFAPIKFWLGGPSAYHTFRPLALPFRLYSTTIRLRLTSGKSFRATTPFTP